MKLLFGDRKFINGYLNKYSFIYNEFGKPYIFDNLFYFNKSHSDELSGLVIDSFECGIDIEKIRQYDEVMASRILSSEEYEYVNSKNNRDYYFTLIWTLKESYLKNIVCGISIKLSSINFVNNNRVMFKYLDFNFKVIKICDYVVSVCLRG